MANWAIPRTLATSPRGGSHSSIGTNFSRLVKRPDEWSTRSNGRPLGFCLVGPCNEPLKPYAVLLSSGHARDVRSCVILHDSDFRRDSGSKKKCLNLSM